MTKPDVVVTKTDTVIMEYFALPVTDTSFRFLYRFLEPVELIWSEGRIPHNLYMTLGEPLEELLADFAVRKWHEMLDMQGLEIDNPQPGTEWMFKVKDAKIIECEMTRKLPDAKS